MNKKLFFACICLAAQALDCAKRVRAPEPGEIEEQSVAQRMRIAAVDANPNEQIARARPNPAGFTRPTQPTEEETAIAHARRLFRETEPLLEEAQAETLSADERTALAERMRAYASTLEAEANTGRSRIYAPSMPRRLTGRAQALRTRAANLIQPENQG